MTRHFNKTLAILIAILLAATFVVAQEASTSSQQGAQPTMQMPMMQTMGGQQTGSMHAWVADMENVVTEAQQSNDPAQMKAALQQVQTRLAQWKEHMQAGPMAGGQGMHSGMQGMTQQGGDHAAHHDSQPK